MNDQERAVYLVSSWQEALALCVRHAVQINRMHELGWSTRYYVANMDDRNDGTDKWAACSADVSAPEGHYTLMIPSEVRHAAGHRDPYGDLIEQLREEAT